MAETQDPSLSASSETDPNRAPTRDPQVQLDALLSSLHAGLVAEDVERRIVIANDRFRELFGLSDEPGRYPC